MHPMMKSICGSEMELAKRAAVLEMGAERRWGQRGDERE